MNFFENVTMRRTRTKSDSYTVTDTINNSTFEDTVSSLPDLSNDDINDAKQQQITKLKEQIDRLVLDLNSAHQEIESLSLENSNLKQINVDMQRKNDLFTKISSPVIKHKKFTPRKKSLNKNRETQTESLLLAGQPIQSIPKNSDSSILLNRTDLMDHNIRSENKRNVKEIKRKNKLCIISGNKNNNILTTAMDVFLNDYETCHYLKPTCGVKLLLTGLKSKLQQYTMNDYCIILIGPEDFERTKDYFELISFIRTALKDINNTNIILCLPTYKFNYYTNMFNGRIEIFNNLLCLDVMSHEYAYVLDSNSNLSYDCTSFNKWSGAINNNGINTILNDALELITEINMFSIVTLPQSESVLTTNEDGCHSFGLGNQDSNKHFFRL